MATGTASVSNRKKYGYSKRNWAQEIFGGDDPYAEYDDLWSRLSGEYGGSDDAMQAAANSYFRSLADSEFINNLTDEELNNLLQPYYEKENKSGWDTFWSGDDYTLNVERALQDLANLSEAVQTQPLEPIYADYLNDAHAQIDSENAELYGDLDKLLETKTGLYNDQLSNLASDYNYSRNALLSQQAQQNAQLMDTLQSSMDRSRRNALEAGASAGMRIADNINTLLTVQNKQSNTSMETANQLAQMMVNQRNAEASIRSGYADTLAEDTANRHSIRLGSEARSKSLADTNYNSAYNSYNTAKTNWDNANSYNPMYDYRNQISKYSKSQTNTSNG